MQPSEISMQLDSQREARAGQARADEDYGRVAYETFYQLMAPYAPPGGMPRWAQQSGEIKKGWSAAALAARALK